MAATARTIVAMQESCGSIPWTTGEHTDVWNHIEAAMALVVAGEHAAADRAYAWVRSTQRHDGSWPMKFVNGVVEDASSETNMSAYFAVGLWHHWLVRGDMQFVELCWPSVRAGLDYVVGMQLEWGGIAWAQEWDAAGPATVNAEALLTGSSSILHSLGAGLALAELMEDPQPTWEGARKRLAHALAEDEDRFMDKSNWSMDWYYPMLGGALIGESALGRLEERWDAFVVEGLGVRCVASNPWVTGAETCELVMALDSLGERERAAALFADMQHLRTEDGHYWTGYVWPDDVFWPVEHTTYTAAAVILAHDALTGTTGGAGIMRAVRHR